MVEGGGGGGEVSLEGGALGGEQAPGGMKGRQVVMGRDGVVWHGQREPRCRHRMGTLVHVGKTLDLQPFCHFEQGGKVFLVHRHFSSVHKLQQGLHLVIPDVLEEDNWMLVWCVVEHALEVGGAGGEDHLVGLQVEPVAGDGDINEGLMVEEVFKDGEEVVLVVVPPQAVLLRLRGGHRHRGLAPHKVFLKGWRRCCVEYLEKRGKH